VETVAMSAEAERVEVAMAVVMQVGETESALDSTVAGQAVAVPVAAPAAVARGVAKVVATAPAMVRGVA